MTLADTQGDYLETMFDLDRIPYGNKTLRQEMRYIPAHGRKMFLANSIATYYLRTGTSEVLVPWLLSDYISQYINTDLLTRETRRRLEHVMFHFGDYVNHPHADVLMAFVDGNIDKAIESTSARTLAATVSLQTELMLHVNEDTPEFYGEDDLLRLSHRMLDVFPTSSLVIR